MCVLRRFYIPFILLIVIIEATDTNDSSSTVERQSRATGRIVKLYSGPRPEPIVCTGEGFQEDPHNCVLFYRCTKSGNGKYTVFRFQCGPGTVYDPDEQICNHPKSTRRSQCGGLLPPIEEVADFNEVENTRNEIPSPITNRPQSSESSTKEPSKLDRDMTSTTLWGASVTSSQVTLKPTAAIGTHGVFTTTPSSTSSQHSTSRDNICTSDGFMGDSENCHKFYRCVGNERGGFTRFEFSCSETTIWDDDNQVCNHLWAVKRSRCGYRSDTVPSPGNSNNDNGKHNTRKGNSKDSIQEQLQISHGTKVTQSQTQISHGNVKQNQTQINYGDQPNDVTTVRASSKYPTGFNEHLTDPINQQNQTQISNGSAVSQTQTQINYGDKAVQTQLQIDHSNEASQTQTQISESTVKPTSTSTQHVTDSQKPSSNDCKESGFMGDPNDCQKFYRCVDNGQGGYTKYEFSCAEGTAWDQTISTCNHRSAVKECGTNSAADSSINTTPKPQQSTTGTSTQSTYKTTSKPQQSTTATSTQSTYETTQNYHTSTTTKNPNTIPVESEDDDDDDTGYGNFNPEPVSTPPPSTSTAISSTTLSDLSDGECTSSGFKGDKNDCKIFYRCVDDGNGGFTKYQFQCGEGTVWDSEIEGCNHEWAVAKCGGETSSDINKVETTTEKVYTTSTVFTPSTTIVHSTTEITPSYGNNDDDDDDDNGYGSTSHSTQSTSPLPSVTPVDQEYTEKPGNQPSVHCSREGFMGDPNNCKLFYRCVDDGKGGFTKYEFTCGDGTYWNNDILTCDHATPDMKCGNKESSSTSKPSHQDTTSTYVETSSTSKVTSSTSKVPPQHDDIETTTKSKGESSTTQKPSSSTGTCSSEGFYADPNDCKKFYRCVDNGEGGYIKYDFTCGDGTVWDQSNLACNHETENCTTSSSESPQSTEGQWDQGSTSSTTTAKTENVTPVDSKNCESEGFFGNNNDCKQFYRCVDNGEGGLTKYDFTCGEGTAWDSNVQTCNHIDQVPSCHDSVLHDDFDMITDPAIKTTVELPTTFTTKATPEFTTIDFTIKSTTEFTTTEFTTKAIIPETEFTTHALPTKMTTTTTTQKTTTTTSSKPTSGSSTQKPQSSDTCESEGYFGNTQDCKKFYRCVDDGKGGYTKYDFDCAEGTIWDPDLTICNFPENVVRPACNQSGSTTDDSSSGSSSGETEPESSSEEDHKTEGTSNNSPTSNVNCSQPGFYPNPEDCKKFYRCVDWEGDGSKLSVYHFECGEGTIWDPALETCNHEESVYPPRDCSGSQSQNVGSQTTEGTTTTASTTKSTTQSTTESTTQSTTESTTQSTTESTTQSTTESTTPSTTESTTQSTTESTTPSTTESTTQSTTESTTQSTTESTTQSTTESTTQSTTESTTQSTTESTTQSTTESTTQSTTESTTQSTTESTTQSTTQSTTESTTQSTAESTTESTTQSTTESATQSTMESTTSQTTEGTTTEQQQESTTTKFGEGTTGESSTTEQSSEGTTPKVIEHTTDQSTTEKFPTEKECPETEDDQYLYVCPTSFRRHPKYCNVFYQCDVNEQNHDMKMATFTCPNNTIYDESQTKCVEENKAETECNGEMARHRRVKRKDRLSENEPLMATTASYACPSPGYYAFETDSECSKAFLKCVISKKTNKLRAFVYQCPKGYVYWLVSRRCESEKVVRDCRRSVLNDWTRRPEIPVERNNISWR